MLRRQALTLGSLLLGAVTLGGWTLFKRKDQSPLLLSARDDTDGKHYAVGYRLDGTRVFATEVGQRCHDIINHPTLPIALFVARPPGHRELPDRSARRDVAANRDLAAEPAFLRSRRGAQGRRIPVRDRERHH